jgi:hypothetical protein
MLYTEILSKAIKHPNLIVGEGTKEEKFPEFLSDDLPIFSFNGFYIINKAENKVQ